MFEVIMLQNGKQGDDHLRIEVIYSKVKISGDIQKFTHSNLGLTTA